MADETAEDATMAGRWLTVHALSEFVFCPRAGILTVETRAEDDDQQPRANLDFSLPYTIKELEQSLQRHLNRLWLLGAATCAVLVGAGLAIWAGRELFLLLMAVLVLLLAGPISRRVTAVGQLIRLRREVTTQHPQEIDFSESLQQEVSWWELLAAGWISARCHEPYRDETLGVSGAPWRTLRRGSITIPVFQVTQFDNEQEPRIFPQHVVRMAGYCHLIETCEGRESPAGIVLFGDSYRGVTLANSTEAQDALRHILQSSRELLIQVAEDPTATSPAPPALCAGCHWGQPRRYRQDRTEIECEGESVPVFGTVTADKQLYHAPCGDRFAWVPPHELAMRLRII